MTTAPAAPRRRLAELDGLRGLAALSVLGYHAWLYTTPRVSTGARDSTWEYVVGEMRLGLVLFFVLSGFLLYGPWIAAALGERPRPALWGYLRRRAARVLPAYYLALVGSIVLLWGASGTPGVRLPSAGRAAALRRLRAELLRPPAHDARPADVDARRSRCPSTSRCR